MFDNWRQILYNIKNNKKVYHKSLKWLDENNM